MALIDKNRTLCHSRSKPARYGSRVCRELVVLPIDGILFDFETKRPVDIPALSALTNQRLFCKLLNGEYGNGIIVLKFIGGHLYVDGQQRNSEIAMGNLN